LAVLNRGIGKEGNHLQEHGSLVLLFTTGLIEMTRRKELRNVLIFFQLLAPVWSFYLPGTAPRDYNEGDPVPLLVNALTPQISAHSKLKSVISYDYYHPQLHFCQPPEGPASQRESFGSVLFGDRLYDSPFEVNGNCPIQILCFRQLVDVLSVLC
jgi:transmembrane 9 superfamily protein 2/4